MRTRNTSSSSSPSSAMVDGGVVTQLFNLADDDDTTTTTSSADRQRPRSADTTTGCQRIFRKNCRRFARARCVRRNGLAAAEGCCSVRRKRELSRRRGRARSLQTWSSRSVPESESGAGGDQTALGARRQERRMQRASDESSIDLADAARWKLLAVSLVFLAKCVVRGYAFFRWIVNLDSTRTLLWLLLNGRPLLADGRTLVVQSWRRDNQN